MNEPFVVTSVRDGIGRITLNEPARLNPVTPDRVKELLAACRAMSADPDARVVVVTGAGRGFCSGADLTADIPRDIALGPASDSLLDSGPGMWSLTAMRQPVIAMVNGAAVGFGAEFALAADIRIAGPAAKFRFPFSLLGTVSDTGAATWLLPRLIGWSRAAEILYSGRMVEADEAASIGLVNRLVPGDDLVATVDDFAAILADRSPRSLQHMKRMIFAGLDERKAEHVLGQYFAFNDRDASVDAKAYFSSVKGTG